MTANVEIFFDLSSPWTRLAYHNFRAGMRKGEAEWRWRPFLVGGVFNAVNDSVYAGRQNPENPKFRLSYVWLREWARLAGVTMNFPNPHHPIKAVKAMRFCCALEDRQDDLVRFIDAAFDAYFADQRNLDDEAVLVEIACNAGLDGQALLDESQAQLCKDRLRSNTDEAIARGAFGSPTFFVDQKFMYFGNDQLPLVFQRLRNGER